MSLLKQRTLGLDGDAVLAVFPRLRLVHRAAELFVYHLHETYRINKADKLYETNRRNYEHFLYQNCYEMYALCLPESHSKFLILAVRM